MPLTTPSHDPLSHIYTVMISSTYKDLIEYRDIARQTVVECKMHPECMEISGASSQDILTESMKMVDAADIYIGIIGSRYGQILDDPRNKGKVSITELEYDRAVERSIPTYIFVVQEESDRFQLNQLKESKIQQRKRSEFLKRLETKHTLQIVTSRESIRAEIIKALRDYREEKLVDISAKTREKEEEKRRTLVAVVPKKKLITPFGGHSTSSKSFVGRRDDLALLDGWGESNDHSVAVIQALGGMGKSTLTWEWINSKKHCPKVLKPVGVVWWNFYDPNATVTEFVRHTLAYITGSELEDFDKTKVKDYAETLFRLLKEKKYLLVMDGLERILIEYRHWNNSSMNDDVIPEDKRRRNCIDPFDAYVLTELVNCSPTRILVSTRLLPTAFETTHGSILPLVWRYELNGLLPNDANELAYTLDVKKADSAKFKEFFSGFSFHPLIITIVSAMVREHQRAPGDFDSWLSHEGSGLKMVDLDIRQRRTMIFEFALRGLSEIQREILAQVAAFSKPVLGENLFRLNPYLPPTPIRPALPPIPQVYPDPLNLKTLDHDELARWKKDEQRLRLARERVIKERRAILEKWRRSPEVSPPDAEKKFGADLDVLVNRGLLQRNTSDQTYDLHPLLRRYLNDTLEPQLRTRVTANVRKVFGNLSPSAVFRARTLRDLEPYLVYYETAISEGKYDEAASLFINYLRDALYRLGEFPRIVTLLEKLYVDNSDPELSGDIRIASQFDASFIRHEMARSLEMMGEFEKAQNKFAENFIADIELKKPNFLIVSLTRYAALQASQGRFTEWYRVLDMAYQLAVATNDRILANSLYFEQARYHMIVGNFEQAQARLDKADIRHTDNNYYSSNWLIETRLARQIQLKIWRSEDISEERTQILELNSVSYGMNISIQYWLAYDDLQKKNWQSAVERIEQVIRMRHQSGMPAGHALALRAEILLAEKRTEEAKHSLSEALEDRNRDRIEEVNFCLSVARSYIHLKDLPNAKIYARQAFELACVQGKPHYYWWGVEQASLLFKRLKLSVPDIPDYDASTDEIGGMPYEFEVREYIEEQLGEDDGKEFPFPPTVEPDTQEVKAFKDVRWVKIGVIAYFSVTDEDGPMLTEIATKLYSLCDKPGPVDPTNDSQLVDPDALNSREPIGHGIEQCLFDEVREELNPITVADVASKHDGISIVFLHVLTLEGKPVSLYMSVRVEKLMRFFEQIKNGEIITIADYGRIIHQIDGLPSREDFDMMFDNWLFVNRYLPVKLLARKAGGD